MHNIKSLPISKILIFGTTDSLNIVRATQRTFPQEASEMSLVLLVYFVCLCIKNVSFQNTLNNIYDWSLC